MLSQSYVSRIGLQILPKSNAHVIKLLLKLWQVSAVSCMWGRIVLYCRPALLFHIGTGVERSTLGPCRVMNFLSFPYIHCTRASVQRARTFKDWGNGCERLVNIRWNRTRLRDGLFILLCHYFSVLSLFRAFPTLNMFLCLDLFSNLCEQTNCRRILAYRWFLEDDEPMFLAVLRMFMQF